MNTMKKCWWCQSKTNSDMTLLDFLLLFAFLSESFSEYMLQNMCYRRGKTMTEDWRRAIAESAGTQKENSNKRKPI